MAQANVTLSPVADPELERDLLRPVLGPTPGLRLLTLGLGVIFIVGLIALIIEAGASQEALHFGLLIATYAWLVGVTGAGFAFVAMLRLTHADYRRSLTRAFEMLAAIIPVGLIFWPFIARLLPAHGQRTLWAPLGNNPVPWDTLMLITWFLIIFVVLYNGLVPDLAALRDKTVGTGRYGLYRRLALGWRGTLNEWHHQDFLRTGMSAATLLFGAVAQAIIAWDLGMTFAPESASSVWIIHNAINYVFGLLALGVLLLRVLRGGLGLEKYIRQSVFEVFGQFMLALTVIWFYLFFAQLNVQWYGGIPFETVYLQGRTTGPWSLYAGNFWVMIFCITVIPFLCLIFRPVRRSMNAVTLLAVPILIGSFLWVYQNCVPFLSRPEPLAPPVVYTPPLLVILGSLGLVAGLGFFYCLLLKLFPVVSLWDMRHERQLSTRVKLYGVDLPAIGKPEEVGTWAPPVLVPLTPPGGQREEGGRGHASAD